MIVPTKKANQPMENTEALIDCTFAILDVKKWRGALCKRVSIDGERIPVTITGFITGVISQDDGVSQEFQVDVIRVEEIITCK